MILGNEGKEFIVTDGENVYKTGAQIITSKVKTVIGGESENIIKTLSFHDEQATAQLNQLKEKYPANLIVITGELTIDLPDKIADYATSQKTFKLYSNRLTFNNCLLDDAICLQQHCVVCVHEVRRRLAGAARALFLKISMRSRSASLCETSCTIREAGRFC